MSIVGKMLALALLAAPCLAHAQISIGASCSSGTLRAEGRIFDLVHYGAKVSYPIATEDYNALYCVTREKCVALGYCKASSSAEQAAADKLNPNAAAERARLQREQQQREAQAERQRKAGEAERDRKAADVARETQRLGSHREAEARRLVEMREAAAKARGGPAAAGARPPELAGEPRKVCSSAPFRTTLSSRFKAAEGEVRADLARDAAGVCRNNTGNPGYSAGAASCVREDRSVWAQLPVAQLAKRPANDPPRFEFMCSASIVCAAPKETCRTEGAVKSSGQ